MTPDRDLGTGWVLGPLFLLIALVLTDILALLAVVHNN